MALKELLEVAVVDDTSVSRGLLVAALEEIGLRNIEIYKNGQEALDGLKRHPRHLVISDMNMPKLDGLQLLEALRGHEPTSQVGFVLVTGRSDATLIERGRQFRMNNYLEKPIDAPKMKRCIEAIVGSID
ncbi:response regulator [Rubrimonas cliftonensis]|uniref:Two-component system, chemotaxis family, response regulator CheY n=1 Tax=Rubrimonas cliftonensis TaxID=89524 RepID=A0A1H4DT38_9RHOB|nr:response regulator [Rubrimonas cliftonensis]SEA75580.1 two-component system, chemotaxis family, response regulator CheY [Rubrimonas cliftonensis]